MPKLAIVLAATVALLFAGLIAWNAGATTSGAAVIGAKAFSPIVNEIGCRLNGPLIGAMAAAGGRTRSARKRLDACAFLVV